MDRQERRDPCGIDHHPAIVSSERVGRQVRRDPYSSETSEEFLTKPTKIPKPNENVDHDQVRGDPYHSDIPEWLQDFRENLVDDRDLERRDSHASSCLDYLYSLREVRIWVNTVLELTSRKTEIASSARGPRSRGAPCRRRIGTGCAQSGKNW